MKMMVRSSGLLLLMINAVGCRAALSGNGDLPNSAFPEGGGAGADDEDDAGGMPAPPPDFYAPGFGDGDGDGDGAEGSEGLFDGGDGGNGGFGGGDMQEGVGDGGLGEGDGDGEDGFDGGSAGGAFDKLMGGGEEGGDSFGGGDGDGGDAFGGDTFGGDTFGGGDGEDSFGGSPFGGGNGGDAFGGSPFGGGDGEDSFGGSPFGGGNGGSPFGGGVGGGPFGGSPFGGGNDQAQGNGLSDLGGFGLQMIQLIFGDCLNDIDLNKFSEDPFADVNNKCNEKQTTTFNNALDNFGVCAGFDLKELIENFASMSFGVAMNCGSYLSDVSDEVDGVMAGLVDMEGLKEKDSPLPRVPQGCVNALVGNNPFGRAVLYAEEYPERERTCFSELADKLPKCTLDEWPVPIVGNWLGAAACIYGGLEDTVMPMLQDTTKGELGTLDACIPEKISRSNCKEIRNKCLFDSETPAMSMALPPPFWSPPMAQTCKDIAADSGMGGLVDKYEAFRQACVPAADLAIWDIAASRAGENAGSEGGLASYMKASAAAAPSDDGSNPSPSKMFAAGLFAGLVVAFAAMYGYYSKKIRDRGGRRQMVDQDDFNSLELAQHGSFT